MSKIAEFGKKAQGILGVKHDNLNKHGGWNKAPEDLPNLGGKKRKSF
jgi:hypothetical protein